MAKKSQGPKEFTARQDTLEFMEKFPPKPGESARAYAKRIEQKMAAARRVETEKTIEKSRASFEKTIQSIEPKQPKPKKAPKLSAADRAAQRASRALAEAAADAAAAKNFKWGRTQAMRAQTMLARGKKPEEVARAIKVPLRSVQDFAQIRFNREAFGKTVYAASNGPRGKVYATTDINDPNVRRDSTGRPIVIRHGAKPGSTSDIGIAPGEKGFRLPSARVKGRTMTAAQKKEVKRLVTGGYGNEELRNYLERIGLPATTISDLAKARKAAGARVPTVAGVSARRSEEAAHEKAIKAQADKQTKAAKARAAAKPRTLGEVGRSVRYVGSAGPSSPVKRTRGGYGDRPAGPTAREIRTAKVKQYKTVGGTTRVTTRADRRGILNTTLQTTGGRKVEAATPYTPYRAPSPKPVVMGGARGGEVSKDAVKIGSDAVYKGIVSIYGKSAANSIMKEQSRNLQGAVRETIQRRIDLGLPVGKSDIQAAFSSGGGAVNVIRGINAFIQDPTSPLIDRSISPYIADVDKPGKIRSYTPGARLMGAGNDSAGGADLKAPSKEQLRKIEKSGGRKAPVGESDLIPETGKVSRIAPVASMDKSDRQEEVKGRGQGALGTGDIPRVEKKAIPLGAEDVRGRGYAASDVSAKLNQIAITDPKRAAKIAESLGIKNFDPAKAAEQGKFQSQQAANTIADVQASMDAEKRRIEKVDKKNPTAAKDRQARQQAEAVGVPKLQKKAAAVAKAIGMTEGSARKGNLIQGGRITGEQMVARAREIAATGATADQRAALASAIPGMQGKTPGGALGDILSSITGDRDLAAKLIPETIGKISRDEYIDRKSAGGAPKQLTAGTAKATSPGRNKKQLLKKISAGLRKVAEQKGASAAPAKVARVKSAPSAPSAPAAKRGRPRKEAAAPQPATATAAAAPAASGGSGGSGGGGGGSRGGGSGAEKAMEDRFNRGGGLEGKIRQIDGALEAKGVPPEKRAQILSDIRSAHGQITASGMSDFQAAKSLGFAGTGISKNLEGMVKISPESKEYKSIMQGAIDRALGRKPADAAPVIKEPKAAPAEKKKPAETPAAAKKKAAPKPEPKPVAKPAAKTAARPRSMKDLAIADLNRKGKPKPLEKVAKKPAEEKKKETARKTAEKKAEQVKKQSEKKVSAPAKPKAIKPMSQEKQRSELAKAAGYRGGAAEAYKSLLRKGVEPQAAKGIVDDGRSSGIKGKQLVDYANRRQKGMDHENAKTAATAKKVGGAPSGPAKAGGKAAAGSSGGSNKPPKGTTSGGRFARGPMPYRGDRGDSRSIVGNIAAGANRGAIGTIKNSIGQITQSLVTAQVIGQVGSLIKQITGGLIGFNMKLEESTIAFKTLFINEQRALGTFTGDVSQATMKADILTKSIQDFANVTPFRFGELVTAAERMKAFGFETKEILPSLQGIGDAVAALGGEDDKLRRITYALGQMKQAGRVYQNDMMQLSNAGIAGYEIIAKGLIKEFIQTGRVMVGKSGEVYKYNSDTINEVVTDIVKNKGQGAYTVIQAQSNKLIDIFTQISEDPVEKIRNLTKRGSIDGQAAARYIIKGMEDTYQGGMEALSRTMQGAISTVQDTSQYIIATSFKPIYDHIRNFFYDAGQFMMKAGGKRIADGIAAAIVPIGDTAARVIPKVASFFSELFSSIVTSSSNFTSAVAKIQVGTVTLGRYIQENIVGGLKSVLDILKTDFGKAAVAAVAAMRIIGAIAAANPLIIALGSIVMAMGAVTNGMQKFIDTGSITRESISKISQEEQATAIAGIQVKESFIEIGSALNKAKKQIGPSINNIFTSLAATIANIGSGAIVTIVNILQGILEVLSKLLSVMSKFGPAIGVAISGIIAIKIAAAGLAITTTAINSIATSMLAVAGAASAVKSGGAVGIIGALLGGGIKNRGANAIAAAGMSIPSVIAQQQAFATGAAVRSITAGEAASSVAITGAGIKTMLRPKPMLGPSKEELLAAKQGAVATGAVGAQAAVASKGTSIFTKIGNVIMGLFKGLVKAGGAIGGFFKAISKGLGKIALLATVILTVIDHFDGIVKAIGAVVGAFVRLVAGIVRAIPEMPILGDAINFISAGIGAISDAIDDIINISINSITNFFNSIWPEDPELKRIEALNTEIERIVSAGYEIEQAETIATAIQKIKDALGDQRDPDWMDWIGDPNAVQTATPEQQDDYNNWNPYKPKPDDFKWPWEKDPSITIGQTILPGNITELQRGDIRDNIDEIIANMDETQYAAAEEAINKAIEIRDTYRQMLIDTGVDTYTADKLSTDKYNALIDSIIAEFTKAANSGIVDEIIPNLEGIIDRMAVDFSDASNGIDSVGYSLEKLQDGSVITYLSDVEGHIEKIILYGEQAANLTAIDTLATSIASQARDAAIEAGITSPEEAQAFFDKRIAEIKIRINRAMEGYYDDPITPAGEELLGRAEAIRRIREELNARAGEVDLGQLYNEATEAKIEKAKTALEKLKEALDPIVDRIISRLRNSAEEQFAERIKKVTSLLEEQREAEIDAINVRVNGINTTYGMLEAEIKAQEKKNRVLQIEKTILDAREGIAKAAISSYGEDVDALDAAINRRDAEKAMTEATKDAEIDRAKLALDSQETTIAGIQTVFDIRISIVTKAIEDEKTAFNEAIDDIVAKIKDGTIKGKAAVNAITGAFTAFGIAVPATAQAIAASGTTTIANLFDKIITAVDRYRNKLLQVKAIEDSIGDQFPATTEAEIERTEQIRIIEEENIRKGSIAAIKTQMQESMLAAFRQMTFEETNGVDGKPIAPWIKEKRRKEYTKQAEILRSTMPKPGDNSAKAIAALSTGWLEWTKWMSSVHLVGRDFVNSTNYKAKGGPVNSRGQYIVGEKGPELITMGNSSGQVISNFYVKKLTDAFKSFRIGNPAIMPKMAYNMGGGGKAEFSVTINNPQVRADSDVDKIVEAVNRSQMRMARRLGYS